MCYINKTWFDLIWFWTREFSRTMTWTRTRTRELSRTLTRTRTRTRTQVMMTRTRTRLGHSLGDSDLDLTTTLPWWLGLEEWWLESDLDSWIGDLTTTLLSTNWIKYKSQPNYYWYCKETYFVKINVRCCVIADIFMIHVTYSVSAALLPVCPEVFSSGLYK